MKIFMFPVLALALLLCLYPSAQAGTEYMITVKGGKDFIWDNYKTMGNKYCTEREEGRFCIPLGMVVSVKKKLEYNELQTIYDGTMSIEDREKLALELERWRTEGGRQTEIGFVKSIFKNCLKNARNKYFRIWEACREEGSGDDCWVTITDNGKLSLPFEDDKSSCYRQLEEMAR